MSYSKRAAPCQKYLSNKDALHKSLSATRFVPFRRSSDTTSDSGSDDFKLGAGEEGSSSFSRSSSESCHSYGANSRYHCILKDLNELNNHERGDPLGRPLDTQESLQDFRSRLACRRKVKTRQVFASASAYQDDDRTDNSCDSATTKAHEEILRSANLLRQEQASGHEVNSRVVRTEVHSAYGNQMLSTTASERKQEKAEFSKQQHSSVYSHKEVATGSFSNQRYTQADVDLCTPHLHQPEESRLMTEFDKILHIRGDEEDEEAEDEEANSSQQQHSVAYPSQGATISRSSTEASFLGKLSTSSATGKGQQHKSAASSPRFSRSKTHSQVLKAATSIPSLIFSNKSLKLQKSSATSNTMSSSSFGGGQAANNKLANVPKKTSMDDDFFSGKTRRSPLRFLGNLVDDKLFRGRWSSTKRAKSTDEITWALANEDSGSEMHRNLKESALGRARKKSLGILSINSTSSNNTEDAAPEKGRYKSEPQSTPIIKKTSNAKEPSPSMAQRMVLDLKKRKSSSKSSTTSSDVPSISSVPSYTEPPSSHFPLKYGGPQRHILPLEGKGEIRAETLAEIEAFDELLKNHLQY